MTAQLEKAVKNTQSRFDESWEEGQTVTMLMKDLGKGGHQTGLAARDLVERKNESGKVMAHVYKESPKIHRH